jgi:hypothetical protein
MESAKNKFEVGVTGFSGIERRAIDRREWNAAVRLAYFVASDRLKGADWPGVCEGSLLEVQEDTVRSSRYRGFHHLDHRCVHLEAHSPPQHQAHT